MAVGFDTVARGFQGANPAYDIAITIAANSNRMLALFAGMFDSGTISVQSVSGADATWAKVGNTGTGNGTCRCEVWKGTGCSSGAQTVTVTMTAAPSSKLSGLLFSCFDASDVSGEIVATSGALNISVGAADMAVAIDYDGNNERTVSGCTTTKDITGFDTADGFGGVHCTSTPTSSFTWSAFDTNSITMGANVVGVAASTDPLIGVMIIS